jgi:hypothetical protein
MRFASVWASLWLFVTVHCYILSASLPSFLSLYHVIRHPLCRTPDHFPPCCCACWRALPVWPVLHPQHLCFCASGRTAIQLHCYDDHRYQPCRPQWPHRIPPRVRTSSAWEPCSQHRLTVLLLPVYDQSIPVYVGLTKVDWEFRLGVLS